MPLHLYAFHAKGHGMSTEGFGRRVTYILQQIILTAPLRTDYSREARVEVGEWPSRG